MRTGNNVVITMEYEDQSIPHKAKVILTQEAPATVEDMATAFEKFFIACGFSATQWKDWFGENS